MAATKPEALKLPDNPVLSQRTIAQLINAVPLETITATISAMLEACTPQEYPDWRARESGVKLWLSYVIGLPVQRQEIVTHKVSSVADPAALLANPATVEAIARQLKGTEAGDKLLAALMTKRAQGKTVETDT